MPQDNGVGKENTGINVADLHQNFISCSTYCKGAYNEDDF
jgi:hypothetical protein